MTATDELRRLLDERGEEWKEHRHTLAGSMAIQRETLWGQPINNTNGKPIPHVYHCRATEMGDGRLFLEAQLVTPEQAIDATLGPTATGETSDGYHTFNELYHHRAVLFSVIVRDHPDLAWKSKLHSDGTMYDGMFIVGIQTPQGQATYHYDIDPYWDMFNCKELDQAPEWDGHTPSEAIERIATLGSYNRSSNCTNNCTSSERTETCQADETDLIPFVRADSGDFEVDYIHVMECTECGHVYEHVNGDYEYCPRCGRKREDVSE